MLAACATARSWETDSDRHTAHPTVARETPHLARLIGVRKGQRRISFRWCDGQGFDVHFLEDFEEELLAGGGGGGEEDGFDVDIPGQGFR